jgi:hypothetical protein
MGGPARRRVLDACRITQECCSAPVNPGSWNGVQCSGPEKKREGLSSVKKLRNLPGVPDFIRSRRWRPGKVERSQGVFPELV